MPKYLTMYWDGKSFWPDDVTSIDRASKIAIGSHVKASISQPRSLSHHRLYWGLLDLVINAQPDPRQFLDAESLNETIKIALGYMEEKKDFEGNIYFVPKSISFNDMDQIQFKEFFNRAVDLIIEHVLPCCEKSGLEMQLFEMLGLPLPR